MKVTQQNKYIYICIEENYYIFFWKKVNIKFLLTIFNLYPWGAAAVPYFSSTLVQSVPKGTDTFQSLRIKKMDNLRKFFSCHYNQYQVPFFQQFWQNCEHKLNELRWINLYSDPSRYWEIAERHYLSYRSWLFCLLF